MIGIGLRNRTLYSQLMWEGLRTWTWFGSVLPFIHIDFADATTLGVRRCCTCAFRLPKHCSYLTFLPPLICFVFAHLSKYIARNTSPTAQHIVEHCQNSARTPSEPRILETKDNTDSSGANGRESNASQSLVDACLLRLPFWSVRRLVQATHRDILHQHARLHHRAGERNTLWTAVPLWCRSRGLPRYVEDHSVVRAACR